MSFGYFDAKRIIKKIYMRAEKDKRYINFAVYELDTLEDDVKKADIDSFGKYVLNKEIKQLRHFLRYKESKSK